jgi:sugar-specific transcriptional regulator TrmB
MVNTLEKAIATLQELGLTLLQAKVYVALINHGTLSVGDLSKFSKVHRTDVYLVVKELEKNGLLERIIANPMMFKAMPLKEVVDLLLQMRSKENRQIRKEAAELKRMYKAEIRGEKDTGESKFSLIPARRVVDRIRETIDQTLKNVDQVITSMRFTREMLAFAENMEKSWSRGVRWRIAIHEEENEAFWDNVKFCRSNKLCQIRFVVNPPLDVMGIYDQKEIFIIANPKLGLARSPALWSNNPELIYIASDHFERVWSQGTDAPAPRNTN